MNSIHKKTLKTFGKMIPIGMILLGVSACSVSQQTASENDGIYYDPSTQPAEPVTEDSTQPNNEVVYTYQEEQPVRIGGKYFDDSGNAPATEEVVTYEESPTYNDDRIVVSNDDYVQWGENEGTEIIIHNNYYGFNDWYRPYYMGWYGPSYRLRWGFGWNSWGYSPFYAGFYGFGYPYSPYYGFYSPYYGYGPYGAPYYAGHYGNPYYHNYYGDVVMRDIYRGRGNTNGVRRSNVNNNATTEANSGIRRSDNNSASRTSVANNSNARNEAAHSPSRRTASNGITRDNNDAPARDNTSPVRIRPRSSQEVYTNGGVRSSSQIRTNTPRPRRDYNTTPTRNPRTQNTPTKSSTKYKNSTPQRRSSPAVRSTPSRSPSTNSGTRRSSSRGTRR